MALRIQRDTLRAQLKALRAEVESNLMEAANTLDADAVNHSILLNARMMVSLPSKPHFFLVLSLVSIEDMQGLEKPISKLYNRH